MRLEIASFSTRDIQFSHRTRFEQGVLYVDRDELRALALQGGDFEDVSVEIVRPGEAVRLIHVMDAVEPRYKPGTGSNFPGFVGPRKTVGEGRTHRLAGIAVTSLGEPVAGEPTYWREAIIDMAGPGAEVVPFSTMLNLVLDFKPHPKYLDPTQPEAKIRNLMVGSALAQRYNRAVRVAQLKAAAHLARTTVGMATDDLQVYELATVDASLPRVVFLFQIAEIAIYGDAIEGILPSLIHPNEILDGALINVLSNSHAGSRCATFFHQKHAIVEQLYARHGTDLNFVGAIVYPMAADDLDKKELMAEYAVKLARMLGAQGACSSLSSGGHPYMEFMLICQKCEQAGIKTVQVTAEVYGTPEDAGFVYFVPEAVAIVTTGRTTQRIELPAMPRVLGGSQFFDLPDAPGGRLDIPLRYLFGACSSTGYGPLTVREH
ncbi:MAG: hypothetical protein HY690_19410 [Chloroflexi bacterium]|nr:hypothetical protein [Chloroflexota bacterium]